MTDRQWSDLVDIAPLLALMSILGLLASAPVFAIGGDTFVRTIRAITNNPCACECAQ